VQLVRRRPAWRRYRSLREARQKGPHARGQVTISGEFAICQPAGSHNNGNRSNTRSASPPLAEQFVDKTAAFPNQKAA
jgi:hypothetical protein